MVIALGGGGGGGGWVNFTRVVSCDLGWGYLKSHLLISLKEIVHFYKDTCQDLLITFISYGKCFDKGEISGQRTGEIGLVTPTPAKGD